MFKMLLGALVAAVAMFVTGFLLYATPLSRIAYSTVDDTRNAAVQASLAQNLPHTGTYVVPWPETAGGAVNFGKGPVALIQFNSSGFSTADPNVLIWGFVHEFIVCFLLGWALMGIDRRVPDYVSRAKTVIMFSVAASAFMHLGNPIWFHTDWTYAIYGFFADAIMMVVAGMVIARWFLPVSAIMPEGSAAK
jgi:hypothetical protein